MSTPDVYFIDDELDLRLANEHQGMGHASFINQFIIFVFYKIGYYVWFLWYPSEFVFC